MSRKRSKRPPPLAKVNRARVNLGNFIVPSPEEIVAAMTEAGAWTAAVLAEWGVEWPPIRGWRIELERRWHAGQRRSEVVIRSPQQHHIQSKAPEQIGLFLP